MGDGGLSELGVCGHWISGDGKPSPILSEHKRSMSWSRVEQALILGLKVYSIFFLLGLIKKNSIMSRISTL